MQETRQQIIEILKTRSQATVDDLADALALTTMTVRHHLGILEEQSLVQTEIQRGRVGRPHYVYRLTISSGPHVELTYPAGGQRGTTPKVQLLGTNVTAETVAVELPSDAAATGAAGRIANPSYDTTARRVQIGKQWTNEFLLEVGELPEEPEQEPNNELAAA